MSEDYTLGQPVTFTTHLVRGWGTESDNRGGTKEWRPQPILGKLTPPRAGIVIGKRTLANGRYDYGSYEDPGVFTPKEYLTAYLVVTDMRSKPLYVLPEHLAPAEPAQDQPAPAPAATLPGQTSIDELDPAGTASD